MEVVHLPGGQLEVVNAELAGLGEDRVVDVGDVANHVDLVAQVLQSTDDEIKRQVGEGVSEVGGVIRRDATDVHGHRGAGFEGDDLVPRGVVQAHSHGRRR